MGLQVVNSDKDIQTTKTWPTPLFSHKSQPPFGWNLPFFHCVFLNELLESPFVRSRWNQLPARKCCLILDRLRFDRCCGLTGSETVPTIILLRAWSRCSNCSAGKPAQAGVLQEHHRTKKLLSNTRGFYERNSTDWFLLGAFLCFSFPQIDTLSVLFLLHSFSPRLSSSSEILLKTEWDRTCRGFWRKFKGSFWIALAGWMLRGMWICVCLCLEIERMGENYSRCLKRL